MPISQKKYINIKSSIGGQSVAGQKELVARIFTDNQVVPVGKVVEFSGGAEVAKKEVANYFGSTSDESRFANKYFAFQSKKGFSPKSISFGRLVNIATPAMVIGSKLINGLSVIQALTDGVLNISIDGIDKTYTSVNFSTATSFGDVATLLTTEITGDGLVAEYDELTGRFFIKKDEAGDGQLDEVSGTVASVLGLDSGVYSDGSDVVAPADAISDSASVNNNFFSFAVLSSISEEEMRAIAEWVQTANVSYMYSVGVNASNFTSVQNIMKGYDGICLNYDAHAGFAEFMPMAIVAAVDYNKPNAAIDAMYQLFNSELPSVETDVMAGVLDELGINYLGVTQQAGQNIAFYQDGVLQGSIRSIGVYANEAWLKDAIFTALLNLRLGLDGLPANATGKSLVMNVIAGVIDKAKINGVISVGKTLTDTAKAYITQLTNDANVWMTVQSNGFWVDAEVSEYMDGDIVKYKLSYMLIYAKGDSVNFIDGNDILI